MDNGIDYQKLYERTLANYMTLLDRTMKLDLLLEELQAKVNEQKPQDDPTLSGQNVQSQL